MYGSLVACNLIFFRSKPKRKPNQIQDYSTKQRTKLQFGLVWFEKHKNQILRLKVEP